MNVTTLLVGAGLAALAVTANAPQATPTPPEDSPTFNCYTDGNGDCGSSLLLADDDGAVLSKANNGVVYVSWRNGTVTPATLQERHHAWTVCVDDATGSDASLFACDDAWQYAGERFEYVAGQELA